MLKIKGKRTDLDVDAEGIFEDNRKTAGFMARLFKKFSAVGLIGSLMITIASGILFYLGLVPCFITLIIGIIMIIASMFSYTTFDSVSKEL